MNTYNVSLSTVSVSGSFAFLFRVGFGVPAQNNEIVMDAAASIEALGEIGGQLALINGPASLPAACVIAHVLSHRFGAVGVFYPKLGSYVISITHDPAYVLGSLVTPD